LINLLIQFLTHPGILFALITTESPGYSIL
jgi:hypothetical protein